MGYLEGFGVTFKHLFQKRVTGKYVIGGGEVVHAERRHGRHVLNRYEDGMEKCIGCELCAGVCPARCIYVRGADNPVEDPVSPGERYGYVYEINYLRCIHCDLCVEACPTEAITESKLFEFSFTNRSDAIYTKAELVVGDDGKAQKLPWEDWRPGGDDHTSAWMRATSPAGNARYENRVNWSGELGYGVRAPEKGQEFEDVVESSGDDHGHGGHDAHASHGHAEDPHDAAADADDHEHARTHGDQGSSAQAHAGHDAPGGLEHG